MGRIKYVQIRWAATSVPAWTVTTRMTLMLMNASILMNVRQSTYVPKKKTAKIPTGDTHVFATRATEELGFPVKTLMNVTTTLVAADVPVSTQLAASDATVKMVPLR